MEITEQDAFKLGFMARCAEEKLVGPELDARLDKVAEFNKAANGVVTMSPIDVTKALGSGVQNLGAAYYAALGLPFAASILGGSAIGYGAGKLVEPPVNDDEIKSQELAATYKLYADKAKQRKKLRQYRLRDGSL